MKYFNETLIFYFGAYSTKVYKNGIVIFDEPAIVTFWPNGTVSEGRKALVTVMVDQCLIVNSLRRSLMDTWGNYDAFESFRKIWVKNIKTIHKSIAAQIGILAK